MKKEFVFILIIAIIVFGFVFETILGWLNHRNRTSPMPVEVNDIYDAEKYNKFQRYESESYRFSKLLSVLGFVAIMLMFFFDGFAYVDTIAKGFSINIVWNALIFFGILWIVSDVAGTPFDVYDTFVIEQKFDFNKTTPKLYITDKLKSYLLTIIIGGGLMAAVIGIYSATKDYFWILAWALVTFFSIFMAEFYSSLIVPLFNKQTPLEDSELKREIETFCSKVGFKLKNVYVIDGSKRSTKANAYFTGLGKQKRIVLYDTLIKEMTVEEIVAVLAHEIGHFKKKHIQKSLIVSTLSSLLIFYLLSLFLTYDVFSQALGAEKAEFHLGLIVFGILFTPISMITGIIGNIYSRKNEYEADKFCKDYYKAEALVSSLKKLAANNLSNLTPHKAYVFINYSHPPLAERIRMLNQ